MEYRTVDKGKRDNTPLPPKEVKVRFFKKKVEKQRD